MAFLYKTSLILIVILCTVFFRTIDTKYSLLFWRLKIFDKQCCKNNIPLWFSRMVIRTVIEIYRAFLIGLINFKNPLKMQFATFFQSEKSIFSVGVGAIHTMFQKLKIFKTVEMPSVQKCSYFWHSCRVFLKKIHVAISGKNPIYNISSIGKKHLFRGFMCFPYHVSEVKNL